MHGNPWRKEGGREGDLLKRKNDIRRPSAFSFITVLGSDIFSSFFFRITSIIVMAFPPPQHPTAFSPSLLGPPPAFFPRLSAFPLLPLSLCSFAASEPSPGLILKAIAISRRRKKGIKGEGGRRRVEGGGGERGGEEKEPPLSYSIDPT